jgi:hypothetical protein
MSENGKNAIARAQSKTYVEEQGLLPCNKEIMWRKNLMSLIQVLHQSIKITQNKGTSKSGVRETNSHELALHQWYLEMRNFTS